MADKKLYTVDWSEISGYIDVAGYKVPQPKMPPLKTMVNYGLVPEKQFFTPNAIPDSLLRYKELTPEEEEWIENEYHKFDNGIWMLIKGQPLYFTGDYYHFLNYWTTESGSKPYFYQPQQKLYNLYAMLDKDDTCLGTALLKARRMRATEITVHRGYFIKFRYRGTNIFMQSKTDDTAQSNYMRAVGAHDKMVWFLKATTSGSTKNQDGLYFNYPSTQITNKSLTDVAASGQQKETIYTEDEIGGRIEAGPCKHLHFDGQKAAYAVLNECFKLEGMSLTKAVSVLRQCVSMNSLKTKVGMLHLESTVEELSDKQLAEVIALIKESNPAIRNKNGRTTSSLFLIFMSAAESGEPDAWGMVDPEATKIYVKNTIDDLKAQGKVKEAADERRKMPLTIEDAITPSGEATAFHKERLQESAERLNFPDESTEKPTVRGNFEWENGIRFSRVIFMHDDLGRWEVSKLTGFEDNLIYNLYGEKVPGNQDRFRCGVDPFDHKDTSDGRRSLGGSVVFEKYDELIDGTKFITETGVKIPAEGGLHFMTNQPVCTYLHRHDDPKLFYEDMLMQCIFYGCPLLCESQKPGLMRYFDSSDNGSFGKYIMNRPVETMTRTDKGANTQTEGIAASDVTINQYFSAISSYVYNYHNAIKFLPLLNQLLSMNRNNVTKHDLGVAFGWCLLAVNAELPSYTDRYTTQEANQPWFNYVKN